MNRKHLAERLRALADELDPPAPRACETACPKPHALAWLLAPAKPFTDKFDEFDEEFRRNLAEACGARLSQLTERLPGRA